MMASLAGCLFLAACSSVPEVKPGPAERSVLYESRFKELSGIDQWSLIGRLAVNDGKDGGSGHINWKLHGETSSMDFHGALGRGAWRLDANGDGAVLELADGEVHRAPTLGQLVEQKLGWEFPVEALAWWVRACTAPGGWERRDIDEFGRLRGLSQFGWEIEYGNYRDVEGVFMPLKLTARRDSYSVKLAIRNWFLRVDPEKNE